MGDFEQARERVIEVLQVSGVGLPDDTNAHLVYKALGGRLEPPSSGKLSSELLAFDDASRSAASLGKDCRPINDARAFVGRALGYVVRSAPLSQRINLGQVRERLRRAEAGKDRIRHVGRVSIHALLRIFDNAPADDPPDNS